MTLPALVGALLGAGALGAGLVAAPASPPPPVLEVSGGDVGGALYSVAGARPGESAEACVHVRYRGGTPARVRLHTPEAVGPLAPYLALEITAGRRDLAAPGCAGFRPSPAGTLFRGSLAGWRARHGNGGRGLPVPAASGATWSPGAEAVVRVRVTLTPDPRAEGLRTSVHRFVWRATPVSSSPVRGRTWSPIPGDRRASADSARAVETRNLTFPR